MSSSSADSQMGQQAAIQCMCVSDLDQNLESSLFAIDKYSTIVVRGFVILQRPVR